MRLAAHLYGRCIYMAGLFDFKHTETDTMHPCSSYDLTNYEKPQLHTYHVVDIMDTLAR